MAGSITQRDKLTGIISAQRGLRASIASHRVLKATVSKAKTDNERVFILRDESGKELVGILVSNETVLTATADDIRKGKLAVTEEGVVEGTKIIPSYHTAEGTKLIMPGKELIINFSSFAIPQHDYTKLQAIICSYNTSIPKSVSAQKVSIGDNVYNVNSTEKISTVVKNDDKKQIEFGIVNETDSPCVIRYITFKEIE